MEQEEQKYTKLREFSRVDALVPIDLRLVSIEERDLIWSKITGDTSMPDFQDLPEIIDPALGEWLKMLSAKLDTVINLLTLQTGGFTNLPIRRVNISAGGMGIIFTQKHSFNTGDILEIKMMLQFISALAIILYGEVVKSEEISEGYYLSLKFIAIDEEIRDEIIKFVFKRQREILREKRR